MPIEMWRFVSYVKDVSNETAFQRSRLCVYCGGAHHTIFLITEVFRALLLKIEDMCESPFIYRNNIGWRWKGGFLSYFAFKPHARCLCRWR